MTSAVLPRDIPQRARVRLHLHSTYTMIGAGMFLFALLTMLFADHLANFRSTIQFRDGDPITSGTLISKTQTGAQSIMGDDSYYVYRHQYSYRVGGMNHAGTSFSRDTGLMPGKPVEVAYVPDSPAVSRIKGMGAGVFVSLGLWTAFGANAMAVAGLAILFAGMKNARNYLYLARNGVLTTGTVTGKTETNTQINDQQQYDVHFSFKLPDGFACRATIRTHHIEELEDDRREQILYDASNPSNAVLVDSLPQAIRSLVTA